MQPQAVGGKHKTNFGGREKLIFKTTVQAWLAIAHWQSALLQAWLRGFYPCPEGEFFVFVFVFVAHLKPRARGVLSGSLSAEYSFSMR